MENISIEGEVWKDVVGFNPGYKVSNMGRVMNKDKYIRLSKTKLGYLYMKIYREGIKKHMFAHRLVALHFIPNPENKPQINHLNGVTGDNRVENLAWATPSENLQHSYDYLGRPSGFKVGVPSYNKGRFGSLNKTSKKVLQFTKDGVFVKEWGGIMDVQRELGISNSNICGCCIGRKHYNTAGGFVWKYA